MQHGQKITSQPKMLLRAAGLTVKDPPEGHLCCGSAGTYNIMQPEISGQLKARKIANIESTDLGFKVFKLNKSNFKVWDGAVENDVPKQIEMAINHVYLNPSC